MRLRPFLAISAFALLVATVATGACGGSSDDSSGDDGGGRADASGGGDDGSGDDAKGDDASASCDGPCNAVPPGLLDPDFTTTWNPGIVADTATGAALGPDGLPVRTTVCANVPVQAGDRAAAIQSALDGCKGKNQVVLLAAGTYSVGATINVPSGVVLRGTGSDAATGTVILSTHGGPVVAIGTLRDAVCPNSAFDAAAQPLLTADAKKETATLQVASVAGLAAGDLALVDQADTAEVSEGDSRASRRRR